MAAHSARATRSSSAEPTDPPGPMRRWGREDEPEVAVQRLLDAAGQVFVAKGVDRGTLADVAEAAGCTRGTVYNYFGDRDGLRRAFIEREVARVSALVARRVGGVRDPRDLLVESVLAAVHAVRDDPVLAAWFTDASAATAGRLALQLDAVGAMAEQFLTRLHDEPGTRDRLRPVRPAVLADGAVRLILSLLGAPAGGSPAARARRERELVRALLVPAVFVD